MFRTILRSGVAAFALLAACTVDPALPELSGELSIVAPRDVEIRAGQSMRAVVSTVAELEAVPTLTAAPLPTGATFAERGDGSAEFFWSPATDQAGTHAIVVSAEAAGKRAEATWTITVLAAPVTDTVDEDPLAVIPPQVVWVRIAPGSFTAGTALTVETLGWLDLTGASPAYRYEWFVNGAAVPSGADGSATLAAGTIARGDAVDCVVTPLRGELEGEPLRTAAVTIVNAPPAAPQIRWSPLGMTYETAAFHVDIVNAPADADGDPLTWTYAWTRDGAPVTDTATVDVFRTLRQGQRWRVQVTVDDGHGGSASATIEHTVDLRRIRKLVTGTQHTCALLNDGRVQCWGSNAAGQLGLDTVSTSGVTLPTEVPIPPAVDLASGWQHVCAAHEDGRVRCWGANGSSQLGRTTSQTIPALVPEVAGVRALAAGGNHTCAIRDDATVVCWGANAEGQLGSAAGGVERSATPVAVGPFAAEPRALVAGAMHTCARLADATLACWGNNDYGQLGTGTNAPAGTPVAVGNLPRVAAHSTGGNTTCAVGSAGSLHCWGANPWGQLGQGSTSLYSMSPVSIAGTWSAVAAGGDHTCAVSADGNSLSCWGRDDRGQLGDGAAGLPNYSPAAIAHEAGASGIVAGVSHTCSLTRGGAVFCWGEGSAGQLGENLAPVDRASPRPVFGTHDIGVAEVAVGGLFACARLRTGALKCWGANEVGQLGADTAEDSPYPVTVKGVTGAIHLTAGERHACTARADQSLACWGANDFGMLGRGSASPAWSASAQDVVGATGTQVAAGRYHTCALNAAGIKCWGEGVHGQLGDNTSTNRTAPATVTLLNSGVAGITAGTRHTCAWRDVFSAWCWGHDAYGQLGVEDQINRDEPTRVRYNGANVAFAGGMAGGYTHTCLLGADAYAGQVFCWGNGDDGQLAQGDEASLSSAMPVMLDAANRIVGMRAVAAGSATSCAVGDAGQLYCWGYPPLGDGTASLSRYARPIPLDRPVQAVSLRKYSPDNRTVNGCLLLEDRSVRCWGDNAWGQLGDGTVEGRLAPAEVVNSAYWY